MRWLILVLVATASCTSSSASGTSSSSSAPQQCKEAGGACLLGGAPCANRGPTYECNCNPLCSPGGSYCCLPCPDGTAPNDAGTACVAK